MKRPRKIVQDMPEEMAGGGNMKLNSLIPKALGSMMKVHVSAPKAKKVSLKLPNQRKVRPRIAMPHLKAMKY